MENIQEALGALFLMAGVVAIVYIIARYTYLIKKAMIEKGLANPESSKKMQYLDIGCIVLSLGLGIMVSTFFTTMELTEDAADLLIWGTILVFGAIGLLAAHWLRKRTK
ncbi:hypothetical protein DSM03_10810 [Leeuwenhoekiella aestuarii]|uniref:DUF6249 domain-containing protein n=1 Tax=Leeuwenhoekiella aestuarii TaxID=2249426 RepID=A0A4V1KP09_9FLAO|nr:DUF6249 domain-containing protein [Leeuwenhoekiella aestuarii]RXG12865.1 hypothetical protein DSM03_10810 [Leeuwenhoekiella aestuarii]RXG13141.1 hypothetical protein DSM04_105119 [Leeuwenhoekiella aestuarii]